MNSILFIYIFSLFVVTSPNFIFKIPIKNHLVVAIIHAAIFSFILYFTYDIVNRDVLESATVNNGYIQQDGHVHTIDGGTTIVVDDSDKSPELNEIQKNAVNIAELEEQHNQSMLDAANNAAKLAKSYAANAQASSTFAIQAASQSNCASNASYIVAPAATEQDAAKQNTTTDDDDPVEKRKRSPEATNEKKRQENSRLVRKVKHKYATLAKNAQAAAAAQNAQAAAAAKNAQAAAAANAKQQAAAAANAKQQAAAESNYTYIGSQNFGSYGAVVKGGQYITDSYDKSRYSLVLETNGSLKLMNTRNPPFPESPQWSFNSRLAPSDNVEAKWEGETPDSSTGRFVIKVNDEVIWSVPPKDKSPAENVGMGKGLILQGGQVTLRTAGNEVIWQNP